LGESSVFQVSDWETIHDQTRRQLRATAARVVSWDDAEDVVQEAFLRALKAQRGFRSESSLPTWLHAIVVNLSLDVLRQQQRRGVQLPAGEWRERGYSRDLTAAITLERAWRALTRRQRTIWYLYSVQGFTHAEIASRLAIRIGTSKSTVSDARARLRRELGRTAAVSRRLPEGGHHAYIAALRSPEQPVSDCSGTGCSSLATGD